MPFRCNSRRASRAGWKKTDALSHQLRSPKKTTRRQLSRAACLTCIRFTLNIHSHHLKHHPPSPPRPRLTFDNMATADSRILNFSCHLICSISLSQNFAFRVRVQSKNCVFSSAAIFAQLPVTATVPKASLPSQPMNNHHVIMTIFYVASENKLN